jgi:uncharacterized protein (DUF2141 family)
MYKQMFVTFFAVCTATLFFTTELPAIVAAKAPDNTGSLTIIVKNTADNQGTIRAGLYKTPREFPMGKVFKSVEGKIKENRSIMIFDNLPEGDYAVAILHDRNDNKKMDYNFLGIPIEGYGFSNNIKAILSAPSFEQAKVAIQANAQQTITISMQ